MFITKTKVITLANHKGHRQCSEPIKNSNSVKRGKMRASESRLVLDWVLLLIGREWREVFKPITNKNNRELTSTLTENRSISNPKFNDKNIQLN